MSGDWVRIVEVAVLAIAGLINYVMLRSIRLAIAELELRLAKEAAVVREKMEKWVETNFQRSAPRRDQRDRS
jgi:hypothetical protein